MQFPDPKNLSHFNVFLTPQKGYWKGATFEFEVKVPLEYPHAPPMVELKTTPIYHPNINVQGKICLNVLREGWQPVMSVAREVIFGLIILFEKPNPSDPLPNGFANGEWEAANLLRRSPDEFKVFVKKTLEGGVFRELDGHRFPKLIEGGPAGGHGQRQNHHHHYGYGY